MHLDLTTLRREFKGRTDMAAYQRFQLLQREQRERRERNEDVEKDTSDLLDVAVSLITASEVTAFRVELDQYDTATIAALQQNELELTQARESLDALLAKAHVLPDGRRVFKTEDGARVFDEFGHELAPEEIEPDEIANERPRWEEAKNAIDRLEALTNERADLLDYQAKLDAARERLDAGDMTREEYNQLREDLRAYMPDAVANQMPDIASEQKPTATTQIADADNDLGITDDMVPTSSTPAATGPGFGS